jgi:hypothetical protein
MVTEQTMRKTPKGWAVSIKVGRRSFRLQGNPDESCTQAVCRLENRVLNAIASQQRRIDEQRRAFIKTFEGMQNWANKQPLPKNGDEEAFTKEVRRRSRLGLPIP